MSTLDDIVAASEMLEEKSKTPILGGSSSEQGGCVKTLDIVGDGLVVELRCQEEDKQVDENGVSNSDKTVSIAGYLGETVGMEGSDDKQLNGSGKEGLHVDSDLDEHVERKGIGETVEDLEFHVGDFVWGKIKSHPWWPGQIYDPKDASEFAMKHFEEGYLLVAFFGDGSCSWCMPSQLVPFVENFEVMYTQSASMSFVHAVQMALDAVSRLIESEITCKCISKEIKVGLARPEAANVGVKTGVLVPEVSSNRLSVPKYEPIVLLSKLRHFAEDVSSVNAFELAVLSSFLSVFCRYKGGYPLCRYHGPYHIEGLEDENGSEVQVANGLSCPMEIPDDPHSDDKIYHRRKQKSIAELMERDTKIKPSSQKRARADERNKHDKPRSSLKQGKGFDAVKEGDKKKKVAVSPKISSESILSAEDEGESRVNKGPLSGKQKRIEVSVKEHTSGEFNWDSEGVTTPRDRKKSKYLSPPYTNLVPRTGKSNSKMEWEIDSVKIPFTSSLTTHSITDEMSEEELPVDQPERCQTTVSGAACANEDDGIAFSASFVDAPVNEVLYEIQIAALNPLSSSNSQSYDMISDFVSIFRSSTFSHGKQGKPSTLHPRNRNKDVSMKKPKSSDLKPCEALIPQIEEKFDASKIKKAEEFPTKEPEERDADVNGAAELILTFIPGIPLPSKEDIIEHFSKSGISNDVETNVSTDSHSIQIVCASDKDAESAFQSFLNQKSFGFESITYRLPQSSPPSRASSHPNETPRVSNDLLSEFGMIERKFNTLSSIIQNHHSKLSDADKSSLKDSMKTLMESIESASKSVTVVEKTE